MFVSSRVTRRLGKICPIFQKVAKIIAKPKKGKTTYIKSLFESPNHLHLLFNNYLQERLCPPGRPECWGKIAHFSKSSQKAKIPKLKVYLKVQNIYIKPH
jgi:hypothetical protein